MKPSNRSRHNKPWAGTLRAAVAARDEALYRRELASFLGTREGFDLIDALIQKPAAIPVIRRSFKALAGPLGLSQPEDLVAWLLEDEAAPHVVDDGARDVVSMAVPYLRLARSWARAAHKNEAYGAAVAMLFFEPVLALCQAPVPPNSPDGEMIAVPAVAPSAPAAGLQRPSFDQITQRA
jgi:hypothetical protein